MEELNYESKIQSEQVDQLCEAMLEAETMEEMYRFLEDICTIKEIQAIAQRLEVAKLLREHKTYTEIESIEELGLDKMPICMAKTQYSLTDDPTVLGRPEGFRITVRDIRVSKGAGFLVALTGDVMTMPGLPKVPAANSMDILPDGEIVGLF